MLFQISMAACSFIYKCKEREYENISIFPNWKDMLKIARVVILVISKDGGRKYIICNKNLIFLGAGKNY